MGSTKILWNFQINIDKLLMTNQWWASRGRRLSHICIYINWQEHQEEGTLEAWEIPRFDKGTREDAEYESNSGPCGTRCTQCNDFQTGWMAAADPRDDIWDLCPEEHSPRNTKNTLQDKYSLFLCRCCKACDYRSLRQCCITMPWLLLMYCFNQGADLFTETLIIGNNLQITNRSVL